MFFSIFPVRLPFGLLLIRDFLPPTLQVMIPTRVDLRRFCVRDITVFFLGDSPLTSEILSGLLPPPHPSYRTNFRFNTYVRLSLTRPPNYSSLRQYSSRTRTNKLQHHFSPDLGRVSNLGTDKYLVSLPFITFVVDALMRFSPDRTPQARLGQGDLYINPPLV